MNDKTERIELMREAKLEKQYNKVFNFDNGIMTMRQKLKSLPIVSKSLTLTNHTTKKIHLEYKKTKIKKDYTIWFNDDTGISVSKLIYDDVEAPARINDRTFD